LRKILRQTYDNLTIMAEVKIILGQSYDVTYNNLTRNLKIVCKLGSRVVLSVHVYANDRSLTLYLGRSLIFNHAAKRLLKDRRARASCRSVLRMCVVDDNTWSMTDV